MAAFTRSAAKRAQRLKTRSTTPASMHRILPYGAVSILNSMASAFALFVGLTGVNCDDGTDQDQMAAMPNSVF
jgi:hypothetical protein